MTADTKLTFTEPLIGETAIIWSDSYRIDRPSIVVNLSPKPIVANGTSIRPWRSILLSNAVLHDVQRVCSIAIDRESLLTVPTHAKEAIKNRWSLIHEIIPIPALSDIPLWRSPKEGVDELLLNLWFAPAGTNCGIHNEHDFAELHTQIYGIGRMQKFATKNVETLYEEVLMAPGMTHEPFYDHGKKYPWHQYYCDTDCVWLAIESSVAM
jgi:hypothetical protein